MKYTQEMIDDLIAVGKLRETDFSNCDLSNLSLKNANLEWVNLWKTNLTGTNLSGANLFGSNLVRVNLANANLTGANLSDANLFEANLESANLSDANLESVNLSEANLSNANLTNISIKWCIGNQKEICNISGYFWRITFTKDILAIGCQQYSIDEWRKFTDEEINAMEDDALEFWTENKDAIFAEIDKHFGSNK